MLTEAGKRYLWTGKLYDIVKRKLPVTAELRVGGRVIDKRRGVLEEVSPLSLQTIFKPSWGWRANKNLDSGKVTIRLLYRGVVLGERSLAYVLIPGDVVDNLNYRIALG